MGDTIVLPLHETSHENTQEPKLMLNVILLRWKYHKLETNGRKRRIAKMSISA